MERDCGNGRGEAGGWWDAAAQYGLPVRTGFGELSLINSQPLQYVTPKTSLQSDQFHVEYKSGVGWDDPGVARQSISHFWWADEFCPLAQTHLCYSFIPAPNNLSPSKDELKGLVPVSRGVKLLPVLEHTYVMNNTCLALLWKCSSITGGYCLDNYAHVRETQAVALA